MALKELLKEKREEILSIAAKHGAYNLVMNYFKIEVPIL
ncbi:hypothetical protein NIES4071_99210 [Calothrix sp. NIES-4071]|nr:hypothetical protein NIES4071_99210 [Calothrix sp. NIES-4071]BAZ64184.1 hypothetical protein NIES4105_99140 [Calothrix sp. NIES-4105]